MPSATWSVTKGTTVRKHRSTGNRQGAGDGKRLYVGRYGNYDHYSFLLFGSSFSGMAKITSAKLNLYSDDGFGELGDTMPSGSPRVVFRRLTTAFSEHTGSEIFTDADDTSPSATTSGQKATGMTREPLGLNSIDITAIVKAWAPSKTVAGGGNATNFGIGIYGFSDITQNWAGISEDDATLSAYKPTITIEYEYGPTTPDVPTQLSPSGAVSAIGSFQGNFSDPRPTDQLRFSSIQVYTAAATNVGQVVTGGTLLYFVKQAESNAAILADRFDHIPASLHLAVNTTYKWRAAVWDQEGQVSQWTSLVSFSVTNTDPNPPSDIMPVNASAYASLDNVLFRGTFTDSDAGDTLLAYQVQLSAYPEGDAHWLDDEFILWNTGKRYVSDGTVTWETPYGGTALNTGTYYWRARQWDNHHGVSSWVYTRIDLTADFVVEPQDSINAIQLRPRAPWRIVIKAMGALRGPGATVAVLEDAMNVGASLLYNSPGEAHWTLGKHHPAIPVIEPKQTHYAIEFRQGDGWREVFAGLVWDFDASDTDVVFYGIDYLALLDYAMDDHVVTSNLDADYTKGGSKYTGKTIRTIVINQLLRARQGAKGAPAGSSPTGFITTGAIGTMNETLDVYSTYQPTLNFIVGLLDSHRQGTGHFTRISVQKTTVGGYQWVVQENPGQVRDNLRLRYGELVQGYRVIPFGKGWATRVNAIGRDKNGVKVRYQRAVATGISEVTWGSWSKAEFFDGVSDGVDLLRRTKQSVKAASKLGKSIALGLRSGFLQPRDGYDLLDQFPVDIEDGSVSTSAFGSGYWVVVGITWQALQRGDLNTTLTLHPREDLEAPDTDLLVGVPISTQAEWQIGWTPPTVISPTSKYWANQDTGKVYIRTDGTIVVAGITGDV